MTPRTQKKKGAVPAAHPEEKKHLSGQWSSTWVFVLAASGAAIGFNNLWQFPSLVATHGGGAFVIVYLLCIAAIGLPLLVTEIMIGRLGRASPFYALSHVAEQSQASRHWRWLGALAMLGGFLIFSYLSVVAGWTMAYTLRMALGVFTGLTADGIGALFTQLVHDPEKQLFWHTLFIVATMVAVGRGLRLGLEPVVRYAAPAMFLLFLVLLVYALFLPGVDQALIQLLRLDFAHLTSTSILTAMSHAFFSLGLGIGALLMYGAYLDNEAPIPRTALAIAGIDTASALIGSIIVFAVLAAGRVEMEAGPTLVFQALPLAFDHLPLGRVFGTGFFVMLVIIALLTAIALVEPVMMWLGERFGLSRFKAALVCGSVAWILGLATILSFNYWAFSFRFLGVLRKLGFFDVLQLMTSQLLLPIGGIAIALFAGWRIRREISQAQIAARSPCAYDAWRWSVRLLTPVLVILILVYLHKLFV